MGLDPLSPGSHPRLQAALNCCATGAALYQFLVRTNKQHNERRAEEDLQQNGVVGKRAGSMSGLVSLASEASASLTRGESRYLPYQCTYYLTTVLRIQLCCLLSLSLKQNSERADNLMESAQ